MWFLEIGNKKLSNYRTVRVAQTSSNQKRHLQEPTIARKNVYMGDWCLFRQEDNNYYLLGNVLSFGLLERTGQKRSQFILSYELGSVNIGALCVWYTFEMTNDGKDMSGMLSQVPVFHDLHPCSCSSTTTTYDHEVQVLRYPLETIEEIVRCLSQIH